jgi:hypothetical protein
MEEKPYFTAGITPAKPTSKPPVARISPQDQKMLEGIKLHSSSPKEGLVSMSDSKGNRQWVKAGRNIEGWNVHSINPDGTSVVMERNGAFFTMPIQGATPTEYIPPKEPEMFYNGNEWVEKVKGRGMISDREQEMMNTFSFQGDPTLYAFSPEQFERIKNNAMQSPNMSDADKANIIHFNDYKQLAESGKLENGKRYFIPRKLDDGNVDFDVFTPSDEQ